MRKPSIASPRVFMAFALLLPFLISCSPSTAPVVAIEALESTNTPVPTATIIPTETPRPTDTPKPTPEPAIPYDPAEEYAVYSALLDWGLHGVVDLTYIVIDRTVAVGSWSFDRQREELPEVDLAIWEELKLRNDQPYQLENRFHPVTGKVVLVSEAEWEPKGGLHGDTFWDRYASASGVWFFSKVGFNAQMNKALVYLEIRGGDHYYCGGTETVYLAKAEGEWTIQGRADVIESYNC